MIVGFDYWQVLSHYPGPFAHLIQAHDLVGDTVHVVSAIGRGRIGTVAAEVAEITRVPQVHEVVFAHPRESPVLKLAKCPELGIELFYDDREDVCRLLNAAGIVALRVLRRDEHLRDGNAAPDLEAERR